MTLESALKVAVTVHYIYDHWNQSPRTVIERKTHLWNVPYTGVVYDALSDASSIARDSSLYLHLLNHCQVTLIHLYRPGDRPRRS